jgi:hypothetical protein
MFHFYCITLEKKLIVSDLPIEKIKSKFGFKFERLTSVKDKTAVPHIIGRLVKNYPDYSIEEHFVKIRKANSNEGRKNVPSPLLGIPRSLEVRAKISAACKGRSNFQGKSHNAETKAKMATAKMGNDYVRGKLWAHDPRSDKEVRVNDMKEIPTGFSRGRDYYSTEHGLYYFKVNKD